LFVVTFSGRLAGSAAAQDRRPAAEDRRRTVRVGEATDEFGPV